jgi:hypothetical protein
MCTCARPPSLSLTGPTLLVEAIGKLFNDLLIVVAPLAVNKNVLAAMVVYLEMDYCPLGAVDNESALFFLIINIFCD